VIGQYIAAAFDIAEFLLTYTEAVYTAAYNSTSHEALACVLYQTICNRTCDVTLDDITGALRNVLLLYEPPGAFATLLEFAAWLATLSLSGDNAIVAAVMLVIAEAWLRGSDWLNRGSSVLQVASQSYDPLTPPVWCDCLECDEYTYDAWNAEEYSGVTAVIDDENERWVAVWGGEYGSGKFAKLFVALPESGGAYRVTLSFDIHNTRSTLGEVFLYYDDVEVGHSYLANGINQIEFNVSDELVEEVTILFFCRSWGDEPTAYAYFTGSIICPT